MSTLPAVLRTALERHVATTGRGARLQRVEALPGSSFHQLARIHVTEGPDLLLKWGGRAAAYVGEARGLRALQAAHAASVPRGATTLGDAPALVMEYIPCGVRGAGYEHRLAALLAVLHETCAPDFGFVVTTHLGPTPLDNRAEESWLDFYVRRRHEPLARAVSGRSAELDHLLGRIPARLEQLLGGEPAPRLLHGDLWSGNVLSNAAGAPVLIDPAAFYGHREMELGMSTLFGGFSPRFDAAYRERLPLRAGSRERIGIYRLYHLVHHVHLFGTTYLGSALNLARRYE